MKGESIARVRRQQALVTYKRQAEYIAKCKKWAEDSRNKEDEARRLAWDAAVPVPNWFWFGAKVSGG